MEIEIDLRKTAQDNANEYYEKSKKAKKKLQGVITAIEETKKELRKQEEKEIIVEEITKKRKLKWFEKFHWMHSSDSMLVLGGRDAQSNEQLIKKYMEKTDLYFHAEIFGAPHCIVKSNDNSAPKKTLEEAAVFAAVFSKAWEQKLAGADVYSVNPEQVSKTAPSGESMATGAFMIYGERKWFKNAKLSFGIGVKKEKNESIIVSGALTAVKSQANNFIELIQGQLNKSETAKKIKKVLEEKSKEKLDLDEIMKMIPNGESDIK
ncbi:MAG TPA: NFACT RNA binding domain-containing protein [archaeon]|nr:NFACT RNA binding domain-containing protein [archaeon]